MKEKIVFLHELAGIKHRIFNFLVQSSKEDHGRDGENYFLIELKKKYELFFTFNLSCIRNGSFGNDLKIFPDRSRCSSSGVSENTSEGT